MVLDQYLPFPYALPLTDPHHQLQCRAHIRRADPRHFWTLCKTSYLHPLPAPLGQVYTPRCALVSCLVYIVEAPALHIPPRHSTLLEDNVIKIAFCGTLECGVSPTAREDFYFPQSSTLVVAYRDSSVNKGYWKPFHLQEKTTVSYNPLFGVTGLAHVLKKPIVCLGGDLSIV